MNAVLPMMCAWRERCASASSAPARWGAITARRWRIASRNGPHAPLIREAARTGKHVFCAKPIALDLASADAALAEVARQGVKLQVGFQRRFDPPSRHARQAE